MTSTAEFSALLEKKAKLEEQIKAEAKEVFATSAKEIFEEYGDQVGLFGWEQYTPYFNDGDPCEFSKHEVFIYSPEEVADDDTEINHWESTGIFGSHANERYHYKKIDQGYVYEFEPWNYSKDPEAWEKFENPKYDPELSVSDAKEAVNNLCNLIDEDTALALFGDHVLILVTPEGVEVEDASSHD